MPGFSITESLKCSRADQEGLVGLPLTGLEHVAGADPPTVQINSDNPVYAPDERSAEEVTIVGRIRRFAREM
jgi:hypothetical protein